MHDAEVQAEKSQLHLQRIVIGKSETSRLSRLSLRLRSWTGMGWWRESEESRNLCQQLLLLHCTHINLNLSGSWQEAKCFYLPLLGNEFIWKMAVDQMIFDQFELSSNYCSYFSPLTCAYCPLPIAHCLIFNLQSLRPASYWWINH